MKKPPIFILTGAPASGKSSVSKALLKHFPYGIHIPVDHLRGMVVSGLSNPIDSWDAETDRQFRLARDSAALIAKTYAQSGFAVVIDDVIFPDQVIDHYDKTLATCEVYKVLLRPTVAVSKARNKGRKIEIDNDQLEQIIEPIYKHFAAFDLEKMKKSGWNILDTSQYSIEETVSEIIAQIGCSPR
jgi:chloramphenicol 3-O-phosphotransferase